jgi:hypothetical protein
MHLTLPDPRPAHFVPSLLLPFAVFASLWSDLSLSFLAECVHKQKGLHIAAASMRAGEFAELRVSPLYGYGDRGSGSFPSIPPAAALQYSVQLLEFSEVVGKDKKEMLFEERLDAAVRLRLKVCSAFRRSELFLSFRDDQQNKFRLEPELSRLLRSSQPSSLFRSV